jgi:hypothetical protein
MNTLTVNRATHINLTYSGQGKYTVTWRDFTARTVRRTINLISWHDTEWAALKAAQLFVDWSNVGLAERGAPYIQELETVTLSSIDADRSAVALTMHSVETAEEVAA